MSQVCLRLATCSTIRFRTFLPAVLACRALKSFGCGEWITPELGRRLQSRNICGELKTKRDTILVARNFYDVFSNGRINTAASLSNSSSVWVVHVIGRANATRSMRLVQLPCNELSSSFTTRGWSIAAVE